MGQCFVDCSLEVTGYVGLSETQLKVLQNQVKRVPESTWTCNRELRVAELDDDLQARTGETHVVAVSDWNPSQLPTALQNTAFSSANTSSAHLVWGFPYF